MTGSDSHGERSERAEICLPNAEVMTRKSVVGGLLACWVFVVCWADLETLDIGFVDKGIREYWKSKIDESLNVCAYLPTRYLPSLQSH